MPFYSPRGHNGLAACRTETSKLRYASRMDLLKMLADLRQERAQIGEAISALERMAIGYGKGRGLPPAWMTIASVPSRRGRPPGSKNKPTRAPGKG